MAGVRAVRKGVRIHIADFDLLGFSASLMPIKNTTEARDTKLSMACPDCAAEGKATPMGQFYRGRTCTHVPADGSPGYTVGQCPDKLRMEGKTPVLVTADELAALTEESSEECSVALTVEKRDDVNASTFPSGNSYWIQPEGPASFYTILTEMADDPNFTFIGTLNLRGTPQLVQLMAHRGGIVLAQILRPSEVYTYDAQAPQVSDQERAMATQVVAALAKPTFDPETYSNKRNEKLRELIAAKLSGTTPVPVAKGDGKQDVPVDLTAALGAALAAIQAAKGA